jgi:hypothetical protein
VGVPVVSLNLLFAGYDDGGLGGFLVLTLGHVQSRILN